MRNVKKKPRGGYEPDGCEPPVSSEKSLGALVADYIRRYGSRHNTEFTWYTRMTLTEAVRIAAISTTQDGKRHPHQRRIPAPVLTTGARLLATLDLSRIRSFDELHDVIAKVRRRVPGLGAVWTYDVATRVATKLKLVPQRVYLHTGTRAGAKTLGCSVRAGVLEMSDLPREIRRLTPAQAEDFLCIYKDDLWRLCRA